MHRRKLAKPTMLIGLSGEPMGEVTPPLASKARFWGAIPELGRQPAGNRVTLAVALEPAPILAGHQLRHSRAGNLLGWDREGRTKLTKTDGRGIPLYLVKQIKVTAHARTVLKVDQPRDIHLMHRRPGQ